jgi:hypothetical protein
MGKNVADPTQNLQHEYKLHEENKARKLNKKQNQSAEEEKLKYLEKYPPPEK